MEAKKEAVDVSKFTFMLINPATMVLFDNSKTNGLLNRVYD